MLEMDADATAELRSLRARAYGPDADIDDDPEALRRLGELEELRRRAEAAHTAPEVGRTTGGVEDVAAETRQEVPAGPESTEPEDETGAAADGAPTVGDDGPSPATLPIIRRPRVWIPAVWVASLVVVAVLVGAWTLITTLTVFTPISRDGAGRQVAVLHVDPDFESPPIFGQGEVGQIGFHDFHGLTAIATNGSWMGGPADGDARCLFLLRTDAIDADADSFNGPIFNDCTAGSFPATIEVGVSGQLPAEIRERFPAGSALQFVLDGDRVGVFTDAD